VSRIDTQSSANGYRCLAIRPNSLNRIAKNRAPTLGARTLPDAARRGTRIVRVASARVPGLRRRAA